MKEIDIYTTGCKIRRNGRFGKNDNESTAMSFLGDPGTPRTLNHKQGSENFEGKFTPTYFKLSPPERVSCSVFNIHFCIVAHW